MDRIIREGRARRALPRAHRRAAFGASGHRRRRDHAFAARGRAHRFRRGDGHLHALRILQHPRVARAPGGAAPELTPKLSTARRLALVWGVHSVLTHEIADVDTMTDLACKTALEEGFAKAGTTW
jgi:hypothetical protein